MSLGEIFTIYIISGASSTAPNGAGRRVKDPQVESRLPDNGETECQLDQVHLFTRHTEERGGEALFTQPQHGACRRESVSAYVA